MSGFTRMCGEEGGPPLHLGYPISDAIDGLFGAIGIVAALYRLKEDPAAGGQEIDCSVTEAMLRATSGPRSPPPRRASSHACAPRSDWRCFSLTRSLSIIYRASKIAIR